MREFGALSSFFLLDSIRSFIAAAGRRARGELICWLHWASRPLTCELRVAASECHQRRLRGTQRERERERDAERRADESTQTAGNRKQRDGREGDEWLQMLSVCSTRLSLAAAWIVSAGRRSHLISMASASVVPSCSSRHSPSHSATAPANRTPSHRPLTHFSRLDSLVSASTEWTEGRIDSEGSQPTRIGS